jgi:hypothetical protein
MFLGNLSSKCPVILTKNKGGDLCVVKEVEYQKALSEHLDSSHMYRRVLLIKVNKIEQRVNEAWHRVCEQNKIPRKIENMYKSTSSNFASIHASIKTHKSTSQSLVIRPIINSIGSPGYYLS